MAQKGKTDKNLLSNSALQVFDYFTLFTASILKIPSTLLFITTKNQFFWQLINIVPALLVTVLISLT